MRRAFVLAGLLAACAPAARLPPPVLPLAAPAEDPWAIPAAPLAARARAVPEVQVRTLSNGVRVWMLPAQGEERLAVHFVARDARRYDERVRGGLGALALGALLYSPPLGVDAGIEARFAHDLQESWTQTAYYGALELRSPWAERALALRLLRARLEPRARLTAAAVERVRGTLLQTRLGRVGDPEERAQEVLLGTLFPTGHPYGVPSTGWGEDLRSFDQSAAEQWLAGHLRVEGSLVLASGVRDVEDFARGAEAALGSLRAEAPPLPPSREQQARGDLAPVAYCVSGLAGQQTTLRVAWRFRLRQEQDEVALVLRAALGDVLLGRLNSTIREERGLSYGARAELHFGPHGAWLQVESSLSSPLDAAEALDAILGEAARLRQQTMSASEFAMLRAARLRRLAREEQDPRLRAERLLWDFGRTNMLMLRPPGLDALEALTPAQLRALAAEALAPAAMQVALSGPCDGLLREVGTRGVLSVLYLPPLQILDGIPLLEQLH